jgi:hypothetical protein
MLYSTRSTGIDTSHSQSKRMVSKVKGLNRIRGLLLLVSLLFIILVPKDSYAYAYAFQASVLSHALHVPAPAPYGTSQLHANKYTHAHSDSDSDNDNDDQSSSSRSERRASESSTMPPPIKGEESRRSAISNTAKSLLASIMTMNTAAALSISNIQNANAAVGTLPEYSDSNAVLQGITIDVADKSQQKDMIAFLQDGFKMQLLRQRQVGSVTDTWMGFGPEQMSIPGEWEPAVSSWASYGGHASVHIRYDGQTVEPYYTKGNGNGNDSDNDSGAPAPGNSNSNSNIAYLQLGVPEYRVSQMVKNGGNVYNGYGIVEVISPSGLPVRGIVGIRPDPMMLIALNCKSVKESKEFYQQLGFVEQEYPYCRPNRGKGQFEPEQPKKSVYLAPSKNSMGVLLLQAEKKGKRMNANPAVRSLNIVFQPSEGTVVDVDVDADADADVGEQLKVIDPSAVPIAFESIELFEKRERTTRIEVPAVE